MSNILTFKELMESSGYKTVINESSNVISLQAVTENQKIALPTIQEQYIRDLGLSESWNSETSQIDIYSADKVLFSINFNFT